MAQLGSALDWGSRGRRFKSRQPDHTFDFKEYMTDKDDKGTLRAHYLRVRDDLSQEVRDIQDRQIADRLFAFLEERHVSSLLIYVSFRSEVNTLPIIEQALSQGIIVATPRCSSQAGIMNFFEIKTMSDLESGKYGILEPASYLVNEFVGDENSICVVPGAAFDMSGYRIGYGAGYYDRYLGHFRGKSIGLAFDCQVSGGVIPHEKYDKPLDFLITHECYYNFLDK